MTQPVFLPQEATEAQRRTILAYSFAAGEAEKAIVTPETRAIYDQYVRGECTLEQATKQAMSIYPLPKKSPKNKSPNRQSTTPAAPRRKAQNRLNSEICPRSNLM